MSVFSISERGFPRTHHHHINNTSSYHKGNPKGYKLIFKSYNNRYKNVFTSSYTSGCQRFPCLVCTGREVEALKTSSTVFS